MSFRDDYLRLKKENYTDEAIMSLMDIGPHKFHHLKRMNGLVKDGRPLVRKPKGNWLGFTEEQLLRGESIGLSRRLMYKRYRQDGWSHEKAVTQPKTNRGRKPKNDV